MKKYPIVVIGAGAAGLVVAIGAAKAGKKVLLIEKGTYGGDCTNFGCIPSKSLIAAAHAAHALKECHSLGIEIPSSQINANQVLQRTRSIVERVRSNEDPAALAKLGVETITGAASFKSPHVLEVNGEEIFADKIVIATGSSPVIPPIPGLSEVSYLTNETIFELKEIPKTLAIMGGGPIGSELSQAFQRLGSQVTLIESQEILSREEQLARQTITKQFEKEGIRLYLKVHVTRVQSKNGLIQISLDNGKIIESDAFLVSVGRHPNIDKLNLLAACVNYTNAGIAVDAYGRTNQRHIFAIGDSAGAPFFTHRAENQARSVLTSLLLPFNKKIDRAQAIPRVTYTDPEIACVGLSEVEAAKKHKIAVYTVPFTEVDRAITTSREEGFIKIVTKKWSSQILGCTIVAPRAGEMLPEILLAMHAKIPLRKLASLIHPYPTYSLAIRKAADQWLTKTILGAFKREKK